MTSYISSTWLLANGVHAILFVLSFEINLDIEDIVFSVPVFLFSLAVSLPLLPVLRFLMPVFVRYDGHMSGKFTGWMLVVAGVVLLEGALFLTVFGDSLNMMQMFLPATIAAAAVVLFRYSRFRDLVTSINDEQHG